jgi:DNA modification methylase
MGMLMAKARLILGDALESLRGMESGSVDAVVTACVMTAGTG